MICFHDKHEGFLGGDGGRMIVIYSIHIIYRVWTSLSFYERNFLTCGIYKGNIFIQEIVLRSVGMKYVRPMFRMLTWNASAWCQVGSSGSPVGSSCNTGAMPSTNCTGGANTYATGHCISGTMVSNPFGRTYCASGSQYTAAPQNGCSPGANADGVNGCTRGSLACHCNNGATA